MKHAPRGPVKAQDPMGADKPLSGCQFQPTQPRCTAHSKQTGKPCKQPAILGGTVCRYHGGFAPQVKAKAQERLMALQPLAIQTLHNLLNREEFPTVQLGAAKDVLDRTEGKAAEQVRLTGANDGPIEIVIRKPWGKRDPQNP